MNKMNPGDLLRPMLPPEKVVYFSHIFQSQNWKTVNYHISKISEDWDSFYASRVDDDPTEDEALEMIDVANGIPPSVRNLYIHFAMRYVKDMTQELAPEDVAMLYTLIGAEAVSMERRMEWDELMPAEITQCILPMAHPLLECGLFIQNVVSNMYSYSWQQLSRDVQAGKGIKDERIVEHMGKVIHTLLPAEPMSASDVARLSYYLGRMVAEFQGGAMPASPVVYSTRQN